MPSDSPIPSPRGGGSGWGHARNVVVTGYGVFTAHGHGPEALRAGVFAGRPPFAPVTRFDASRFRARHAAVYEGADAPRDQRDLLVACGRSALEMAGVDRPSALPALAGTPGSYSATNRFWRATVAGEAVDDGDLAHCMPARLVDDACDELGLGRPRIAFVDACVASTNAIVHGCQLIASGAVEAVLCAGSYLVEEEAFAKFDSGLALSTTGRVRPFSRERSGLLLGDGGAAIVLESGDAARARGATALASVAGWGMAADAHLVVRPHPEGRGLAAAVTAALRRAGVDGCQVGYVNAHGTGTVAGDAAEVIGLRAALGAGADRVPVSSTKGTTGHMLEATGAVEVIVTLLALRDGVLPPTAGLADADLDGALDHVPNEPREADVRFGLSVNSSFGGLNAAVLLERAP